MDRSIRATLTNGQRWSDAVVVMLVALTIVAVIAAAMALVVRAVT